MIYELTDEIKKAMAGLLAVKTREVSLGRAEIRDRHAILGLVGIFERVCETMAYAHAKGIIHRDLKPANIMVDRFGAVFVMDLGIAKRIATDEQPADDSPTQVG